MSDEDRDVDIESDDDVDSNSKHSGGQFQTQVVPPNETPCVVSENKKSDELSTQNIQQQCPQMTHHSAPTYPGLKLAI